MVLQVSIDSQERRVIHQKDSIARADNRIDENRDRRQREAREQVQMDL